MLPFDSILLITANDNIRIERSAKRLNLPRNKIKDRLRAEEKYYRNRIVQEFDSMSEIKSVFLEDLEKNISLAQGLLQRYTEIFVKIDPSLFSSQLA